MNYNPCIETSSLYMHNIIRVVHVCTIDCTVTSKVFVYILDFYNYNGHVVMQLALCRYSFHVFRC